MDTRKIVAPKKLIEVALPLDDINKASAREKSIRHGHPSTLHLWWARRPLAAARAVLFAQLVNDPSWKYTAEELKKPQVKSAITRKRNELFRLISELVQWENTNNQEVLERARKEIRDSWRETCEANKDHPDEEVRKLFDPKKLPPFHDPFAGGGSIPLEAQRLGLEAHASDLNPVAVLINKAMIEIPPRFAGRPPVGPIPPGDKQARAEATEDWSGTRGLAEDVRRYGAWMREEAWKRIGHLYPKVKITAEMVQNRPDLKKYEGQELTVIAWLWTRTVRSPNPAFSHVEVPLASTFMLSTKVGREAYVKPVVEGNVYRFTANIGRPDDVDAAKSGTSAGKWSGFRCLLSNVPISYEYIRGEGTSGRLGSRLMAVIAEGIRERVYLSPDPSFEAIARQASPSWRPDLKINHHPRDIKTQIYGLTRYGDLFTPRQLVALTTFTDLVHEAREQVNRDALAALVTGMPDDDKRAGITAYADGVSTYLACAVDRVVDRHTTIATWDSSPSKLQLRNTFARQALPMSWDFGEGNPFCMSSGTWSPSVEWVAKSVEFLPSGPMGISVQADASKQEISRNCVVSTDPPYYDNIGYADLSDFFYVWLRRSLKPVFPDLFATIAVPKAEELVATPYRHGSKDKAEAFFLSGMTQAMQRLAEQAHPAFPVSIYYAFKQNESDGADGTANTGWDTFLDAVIRAGFAVSGTWPMRTELGNRMIGMGSNALASSIILVCSKRPADAPTVSRRDFLRELDRALPIAIADMTADPIAAIAPVDLAQATIGPGMAIFSKYKAVLEADGNPMSVHNALIHINKAIDDYFAQAEGELDADTRFCIDWFQQYGFDPGPFGEADVLARAKGTSVDGVREAGVLDSAKGKVRLLRVKDYPPDWDPATDHRTPIWEACHQMCRALSTSERDAGALLARMPQRQDPIRQLAYRLYTLCERKGRAEEARSYNELVTSWPTIIEQSLKAGLKDEQLDLLS